MKDGGWGRLPHRQQRSLTPVGIALQGSESASPYIIHSFLSPARVQSLAWVGGLHSTGKYVGIRVGGVGRWGL